MHVIWTKTHRKVLQTNDLFAHQQKELKRIRNIEEGAYFNGCTYAWMFGLAFVSWAIILVEIAIWICIKLF